jgi:hypothetical protein
MNVHRRSMPLVILRVNVIIYGEASRDRGKREAHRCFLRDLRGPPFFSVLNPIDAAAGITPGYVACNVACSAGRAYRGVPAGVILDGTSVVARLIFQHGEEREDHGAHGEGFIRALRAKRIDPTSVALCGFTFLGALCVKPAFLTQARSSMISYQPPKSIIHKNARSRLPLNGRSRRWRTHRVGAHGYGDNARGSQ